MNVLVSKLGDEAYETQQRLESDYQLKAKQLEKKFKDDIQSNQELIENLEYQLKAEKQTKQMLDENLELMTRKVSENDYELKEKEKRIKFLERRVEIAKSELTEAKNGIEMKMISMQERNQEKLRQANVDSIDTRAELKQLKEANQSVEE